MIASPTTRFPRGFLWGAATSAYQIEGSPLADGAGPSIWHRFAHTPGRMAGGETGDVACDHYRRYREDVALMRDLGLETYRFSLAWSRILPDRARAGEPGGSRLLFAARRSAARERHPAPAPPSTTGTCRPRSTTLAAGSTGISPPGSPTTRGLWSRRLGDRVKLWATINEPWVVVDAGYVHGVHAPGHKSLGEAPIATHNVLRAHGAAVQAFRAEAHGEIGLVVNLEPKVPASDSPADLAATRRADAYMNRQYLDPVFLGSYPEEMAEIFG